MNKVTPSMPLSKPNQVGEALVALALALQARAITEEAAIRSFLTCWMAEYPVIAYAQESFELLERVLSARELVSRLEVAKHLNMCEPVILKEV